MEGEDLIKSAIGKKLKNGKVQSFYLDNKLSERINVTFLEFDNWIRIVTTDEVTSLTTEASDLERLEFGDEEFKYKIEAIEVYFPEFKKYIGKSLTSYKELVLRKSESLSFGLNLYFEDGFNLIIHNQDYPIDKTEYLFENTIPQDLKEK
ncbi:hypothetical protein MYP_5021 [Sporocytophaga myxococcoides]|uniref:Uncharacterized protein n=1 Tax=Sporocytophaga myxococcoides TaxID=153721 RepID=A0A098LLF3_9BACT|nr:hypothetical protein [Sporocytophaga myxococcoides]GAL87790.1 hypothetical protein MYP_5021 [Sporocytophaga myxococcoides]